MLAACLALAWLVVRLLRGHTPRPTSVWFGERIVDGVLFPVLALAFALLARWLLGRGQSCTPWRCSSSRCRSWPRWS